MPSAEGDRHFGGLVLLFYGPDKTVLPGTSNVFSSTYKPRRQKPCTFLHSTSILRALESIAGCLSRELKCAFGPSRGGLWVDRSGWNTPEGLCGPAMAIRGEVPIETFHRARVSAHGSACRLPVTRPFRHVT